VTAIPERLVTALADRYRIERELGAGGMATVYLAADLKHDRKVAIKVLKPELAAVLGAERFVQEIKTTAALSHPHILPLFDSGEAGGFLYYVMPYIQGETIREKLNRETQFGIDEAVKITTEVADALDYAHQNGVIHRDIKPENILLHNGRPMVMDFGIALAVSAAAGGRMTETGLSLGTPHYMSPEQATADKQITARSDVYSLASVLYEMLTGSPPHVGSSAQQIIMKIIAERAQPVTELRASVPPNIAAALAMALEKLPADRFDTAKAFSDALGDRGFRHAEGAGPAVAAGGAGRAGPWRRLSVVTTSLAVVFALAFAWSLRRPEAHRRVARYGLAIPTDQRPVGSFAWAPDDSWLVYVGPGPSAGEMQLWVKVRDRLEVTPLAGTTGAEGVSVSPDGQWIVFVTAGQLRRIPATGGAATTIADGASEFSPIWLNDGAMVYSDLQNRLRRVPATGGTSEVVFTSPAGRFPVPAAALPNGRDFLFLSCQATCAISGELWVADGGSAEARLLLPDVSWAAYAGGLLLFARRDGGVFAVRFDLAALRVDGAPVVLLDAAVRPGRITLGASGTLAYIAGGGPSLLREAVWVSRDGQAVPVDTTWGIEMDIDVSGWSLSPDGERLAITIQAPGGSPDVWIKVLDRGAVSRLTFADSGSIRPRWTPDGRGVTFFSRRTGDYDLYQRRADGTGADSLLLDSETGIYEALWSSDRKWLVLRLGGGANASRDIVGLGVGRDTVPRPLLTAPFDEEQPALSPDGRWLAYASTETGRREVYVRPFPDVEAGKWQVSTAGGTSPVWAHSGRELFFINDNRDLMSQAVLPGAAFQQGEQRVLFRMAGYTVMSNYASFDVSPDDRRFLMLRRKATGVPEEAPVLVVVENWLEEVNRVMKGRSR
jgi:Tol biopolymer transport system component